MIRHLIAAIFVLGGLSRGQGFRTAATDIVVADIVNGYGAQAGSDVRANASIQVIRVLQGDSRPGLTLSLEWSYHPTPLDPPAANIQIPAIRGLFFLKKTATGNFEPLPIPEGEFGGVLVQMPKPVSDRVAGLPQDAPLDQRLAREVQWALEELVRLHGAEINARRANAPPPRQLQGLFAVMDALKIENSLDVYRELSASADPNLKLAGLMGRLKGGDTSALLEMEKAQASLKPAYNVWHWSPPMGVNLSKDIQAAHAMGRIALSESPIPAVEGTFPARAGMTHNVELLPYLAVMLKSPNLSVRDSAVMSICELIGPPFNQRSRAAGLWVPEMNPYCPMQSPIAGREQEQKDLAYWSEWWDSHNFQIGQTVALPRVTAPARYQTGEGFVQTELSIEQRFRSVLGPRRNAQTSQPGRAPIMDPVTAEFNRLIQQKKLDSADLRVWNDVADATAARIAATDKKARDLADLARTQGPTGLQQNLAALNQELEENLRAGLEELRNRLSKDGWAAAESAMNRGAGVAVRVTLPQPASK